MLTLFAAYKRRRRLAIAAAAIPPLLIAVIVWMPKDRAHASQERLALTIAVYLIAAGGLALATMMRRRAREARLAFRYHGAPRALGNTVSFISAERRSASQGALPALVGAIILAGLWTISPWPQLATLTPYRNLLGIAACTAFVLASLALFWRRNHRINGFFLRRYLREQGRHVGFRPRAKRDAKRLAAELAKPAVTQATADGFRAAGFDWQLDDGFKNILILGQPGAGKTVTVINCLLESMFATSAESELPAAGIILDPKSEFKNSIGYLAQRYGREDDLLVFGPNDRQQHGGASKAAVYNPLNCADDALEISARLITAGRLAGGIKTNDSFFIDSARTFLRHAIELIRVGNSQRPPSLFDLQRLATQIATDPKHDGPFYLALNKAIVKRYPDDGTTPHAVNDAVTFFETEYRRMPDRQRGGLIGTITQLIDEFSVEAFRSIMSGKSTIIIPDIIDQGKILYIDLPIAERPRMSLLVTTLIKLHWQKEILRRVNKPRPSFMVADEYHTLWIAGENQGDADFFALSRGSRHSNIIAAQNISAFYKKSPNKDEAKNFLGNCATKIFLRNTETETNEWASKLFGERSEIIVGANESASLNDGLKRGFTSYGRSTATVRIVPPEAFSALAIPMRGDPGQQYAESIVHLATRATTQQLDLCWRVHPLEE